MKPSQVSVSISIPFVGQISGTWAPADAERKAAWELYLELTTRITVVPLGPEDGKLREALASLYSIFGSTREILRRHGPDVAPKTSEMSLGRLAVAMLNTGIRPVLAKWHPRLLSYESTRPEGADSVEFERAWDRAAELRTVIDDNRALLTEFARQFGEIANVASLLPEDLPIARPDENGGGGGVSPKIRPDTPD